MLWFMHLLNVRISYRFEKRGILGRENNITSIIMVDTPTVSNLFETREEDKNIIKEGTNEREIYLESKVFQACMVLNPTS